jgi:hypothetical protein
MEPDITVTLNFHREGALAHAALASLGDLVNAARNAGLTVETQAILDRPDELTRHIVGRHGRRIDKVEEVSLGDLGLSRNAGARLARGRFLAFLDGDDLWGNQWLRAAFASADAGAPEQDAIWHANYLYVFNSEPADGMSGGSLRVMSGSDTPGFNPDLLLFGNLWSANTFARRDIYLRLPYRAVARERGLGIEDWSWNLETLWAGIAHCVVPGTVHLIRRKSVGSLDRQNAAGQLLPYLPPNLNWGSLTAPFSPDEAAAPRRGRA